MTAHIFAPFETLAERLLPHALEHGEDGSHDLSHLARVWKNAAAIQRQEGGDAEVLCAAALLHDCVSVEKNSPDRNRASRLAAEKASMLLRNLGWDEAHIGLTAHAIEAHSFSANIEPVTTEAKYCRMPTGSMPSASLVLRGVSTLQAAWAAHFTTGVTRTPKTARWMTSALRSIISARNCLASPPASRRKPESSWPLNGTSGWKPF